MVVPEKDRRELEAGAAQLAAAIAKLQHRPELAATLGADRFLREVEIAAKLSHPHILPVFDSGDTWTPTSFTISGCTAAHE